MNRRSFFKFSMLLSAVGVGKMAHGAETAAATETTGAATHAVSDSNTLYAEQDGWIVSLQQKAALQEREIERLRVNQCDDHGSVGCEELEQQLQEIKDSRSWRVTRPLRRFMNYFRD